MKDYKLSEIITHCKKMHAKYEKPCFLCKSYYTNIYSFCYRRRDVPTDWEEVNSRDVIELPCKESRVNKYGEVVWDVYYRNVKYGYIDHECFADESKADVFLEQLRGDKE